MVPHIETACALALNDEERCIAVAREFMRDSSSMSDPTRMFSLMCRLCQSPVSWYASGPTQKYILRQIRIIDAAHLRAATGEGTGLDSSSAQNIPQLDVCLLMLYGHILFTSSSYTFALSEFFPSSCWSRLRCMYGADKMATQAFADMVPCWRAR
jgi:general transcription factor 3C polypeptide 3 (transcription factor C subunit 4)